MELVFLILYSLDFHLVADQLVDVSDDDRALDVHQDEGRYDERVEGVVRAGRRSGVDVEFVLVLVGLELVGVAGYEDVDVQLALNERQRFGVAPRDHLMAVSQPDPELAHGDHLLLRVTQVLGANFGSSITELTHMGAAGPLYLVEVPANDVHVIRQCLQVVERVLGAQIARTQNVLNPAGHQELLEFRWQTAASMRNVQISEHQHQLIKKQ